MEQEIKMLYNLLAPCGSDHSCKVKHYRRIDLAVCQLWQSQHGRDIDAANSVQAKPEQLLTANKLRRRLENTAFQYSLERAANGRCQA